MWLIILAGVILGLVLLYWVVRVAAMDGVAAAFERAAQGDRPADQVHPTDLIGLSQDKAKRRPSGPSNY